MTGFGLRGKLFFQAHKERRRAKWRTPVTSAVQASATIFLILRRMRAPMITLIAIFAVSVLGLTLVPGRDPDGHAVRMSIFDAFYFMSYTATTIGFGEIPHAFTAAQRLWVTITVYLTVIGWAYAFGSVLTLLQDRTFRQALALQHFTRKVRRLREPFLLFAGYGRTGRLLGRAIDDLGRRFVVVDLAATSIDSLDLDPYRTDVPGLVGDVRNPHVLEVAGLGHPDCEGVIAMTDDDEANLAVVMAAALLRPDLPMVARTVSPVIGHRMRAFGRPTVINPFDRFGDHLRLALRAPASYQLMIWLEGGPGAALPPRAEPPPPGRWVVCGFGRFGRELAADLRAHGSEVTVVDLRDDPANPGQVVVGDASDPAVMKELRLGAAVGFIAGTDADATNLSLVAAARHINDDLYVVARQNHSDSSPLFGALQVDSLLVAPEVVSREAYARLSTPLLWKFIRELPQQSDEWAEEVIGRLAEHCGWELQSLWKVRLVAAEAPAVAGWLMSGKARLGTLLRDPEDRDAPLEAVTLLLKRRDGEVILTPSDDVRLDLGDELLLAGRSSARTGLTGTLTIYPTFEYVVNGREVPSSWIWRLFSKS